MSRELVGSMIDLSFSMTALGARQLASALGGTAARHAAGEMLRLAQQSAEAAHATLPGGAGLEWRELANKLAAFGHFQQAPELLGMTAGAEPPLSELLRRAAALGTYRAVWATEGLGFAVAERAMAAGWAPGWLREELGRATVPLHTGAGLSSAGRLLANSEVPGTEELAGWLAGWEEGALAGSGVIAVEALGLVARNLYPHLVPRLAARLAARDPVLAESLWHGVGRGLYFAPTHALPYSAAHSRAFAKAWREPPDEPGRRNATAGLAWALTLVNLRDPELLADVLRRHGREIVSPAAFADGVAAALLIWYDAVGHDSHLAAFLAYRPVAPASAVLWEDLVLGPCAEALQHTYPQLRRSGGLATLFRCPPLPRRPRRGGTGL